MWMFTGFAASALALLTVGIYGLVSYSVARRKHEIGVRVALGAAASSIYTPVLGESLKYVLAGLAAGLPAAAALTARMTKFLDPVSAADPVTYVAVALIVIAVAGTAAYIPARRAVRQDPAAALRVE